MENLIKSTNSVWICCESINEDLLVKGHFCLFVFSFLVLLFQLFFCATMTSITAEEEVYL